MIERLKIRETLTAAGAAAIAAMGFGGTALAQANGSPIERAASPPVTQRAALERGPSDINVTTPRTGGARTTMARSDPRGESEERAPTSPRRRARSLAAMTGTTKMEPRKSAVTTPRIRPELRPVRGDSVGARADRRG